MASFEGSKLWYMIFVDDLIRVIDSLLWLCCLDSSMEKAITIISLLLLLVFNNLLFNNISRGGPLSMGGRNELRRFVVAWHE